MLLAGLDSFETRRRAARAGRNPQTGESITIPESAVPKFTPAKRLKDRIAEAHKPEPKKAKASAVETGTEAKAKKTQEKIGGSRCANSPSRRALNGMHKGQNRGG